MIWFNLTTALCQVLVPILEVKRPGLGQLSSQQTHNCPQQPKVRPLDPPLMELRTEGWWSLTDWLPPLTKMKHWSRYCSVAKLCPTLCNPMDCSTPGFPALHYLPEFVQTHVHWVGGAIQPPHLLLPSIFPSIRILPMNIQSSVLVLFSVFTPQGCYLVL